MSDVQLCLNASSHFAVDVDDDGAPDVAAKDVASKDIARAFAQNSAAGLVHLAARANTAPLGALLAFGRDLAALFLTRLCQLSDEDIDSVDGVVRALDAARIEMGLSKAELARAIGMMPESTRRLFTAKGANPSIETVMKLADALGLELTFTPKKGSRPKHAARASA